MTLRWNKKTVRAYHNWWFSPDGQIVLKDLEKRAPMLTEGLRINDGVDVNKLLVQEGRSDVLKYIYKMMGRDPNEEQVEKARNEARNI